MPFTDKLESLLSGASESYGQYQQMAGRTKEAIESIPHVGPTINKIAGYLGSSPEVTEATGTISGLMGVPLGFVGPQIMHPSVRGWGQRIFPRLEQFVKEESRVSPLTKEATEKTLIQITPESKEFLSKYSPLSNIREQPVIPERILPGVSAHEDAHIVSTMLRKQNPTGTHQALNELVDMAPKELRNKIVKETEPLIKAAEKKFFIEFPEDVKKLAAAEELGATITAFLQGYGTNFESAWMRLLANAIKKDPESVRKMTLFWKDFLKNPMAYGKQSGKAPELSLSDLITNKAFREADVRKAFGEEATKVIRTGKTGPSFTKQYRGVTTEPVTSVSQVNLATQETERFVEAARQNMSQRQFKEWLDRFPQYKSILKRGEGGPVAEGQPSIVGEKGPEIMIPTKKGVVLIPLSEMVSPPPFGGTGTTINDTIDISYLDNIPKHPNDFTRNMFGDIINPKTGERIICPVYGASTF